MALDLDYFRNALEEERSRLEGDLAAIAHRNPEAPEDWSTTFPDMNLMKSDKNEMADEEEELENRSGVEFNLESRLRDVNEALEKIRHGKYGICSVDGEPIAEARLKANPAALFCIEHAN